MRENINVLRKRIDRIDEEIFLLLKKRFRISKKVGKIKKKNKIVIRDNKREKEIINKQIKKFKLNRKFVKNFYKNIFAESRRVQKWRRMVGKKPM